MSCYPSNWKACINGIRKHKRNKSDSRINWSIFKLRSESTALLLLLCSIINKITDERKLTTIRFAPGLCRRKRHYRGNLKLLQADLPVKSRYFRFMRWRKFKGIHQLDRVHFETEWFHHLDAGKHYSVLWAEREFPPFLYRILIRVHGLREHDKVYDERLTYYLRESDHITEWGPGGLH